MSQMGDECYSTNRINAVCEQLAGFILNEILDSRGEFYHDGTSIEDFHRRPDRPSSWTINMTCTFVNIFKCDALFCIFVNILV